MILNNGVNSFFRIFRSYVKNQDILILLTTFKINKKIYLYIYFTLQYLFTLNVQPRIAWTYLSLLH